MILKKGIATVLSSATILTAVSPCAFAKGNSKEETTKSMSTTGKVLLGAAGAIGLAALGGIIYHTVKNSHVKVETLKGKPIYNKYMELKDAVIKNECEKVAKILNENKDLDISAWFKHCIDNGSWYTENNTLLHIAVQHERYDICKLLISRGADVNAGSVPRSTPLHYAIVRKRSEICKLLLKKGAHIHPDSFYEAVDYGYTNIYKLFINNGFDIHANKTYLLHEAAHQGNHNVLNFLLDKGIDVNIRDNSGKTPLHKAVQWNCLDLCKLLLEKGAYINAKDNYGSTPLDYANIRFFKNSNDIKNLLIKNGAKRGSELK